MSTEPREKRSSFADLAKLAQMTPPPSAPVTPVTKSEREENSGVINLAALQASEEQSHAAAAAVAADALAARAAVAPVSSAPAAPSLAARESFGPSAASGPRRALAWLAVAGIAAAAAAAGGAIAARKLAQPGAGTVVAAASAAPGHASDGSEARTVAQNGSQAQRGQQTAGGDAVVDPSNLPRADKVAQLGHAAAPARGAARPAANDKPEAKPETKSEPAPAPIAEATPGAGAGGKSLETLIQEAAGSPKEQAAPAIQPTTAQGAGPESSGSVPLRPSQGAINGALGTVLPAARACVDEDAPVSRASVTFNSDGSVGTVSVSGWAVGKPAEACIRAALTKARVPPFAQPTFTAPATIRSN
jgi:hypothetical protein